MAVPVPRNYIASETVSAAILNGDIRDVNNWQFEPPRAYAYRNADKSTSNGVTTVYDMDLELFDSHGAHSTSTNNSRLIAPEPGIYLALCQAKWAAHATGSRRIQLRKNAAGNPVGGSLVFDTASLPASGNIGFAHGAAHVQLSAGDYIELFTDQTSGGSLNVIGGAGESYVSFMWSAKL